MARDPIDWDFDPFSGVFKVPESARPASADAPVEPVVATPTRAPEPPMPPKERASELARRAVRPKSPQEAALEAVAHDARRRTVDPLRGEVTMLVARHLGAPGPLRVESVRVVDDPHATETVWRAHRVRFLQKGDIERATAAAQVIDALGEGGRGRLAMALVRARDGFVLAWFDLARGELVAAFRDGDRYVAG